MKEQFIFYSSSPNTIFLFFSHSYIFPQLLSFSPSFILLFLNYSHPSIISSCEVQIVICFLLIRSLLRLVLPSRNFCVSDFFRLISVSVSVLEFSIETVRRFRSCHSVPFLRFLPDFRRGQKFAVTRNKKCCSRKSDEQVTMYGHTYVDTEAQTTTTRVRRDA